MQGLRASGGDEFVVVVAPASTGGLLELADTVRDVLFKPYLLHADAGILVTSSVGAAASEHSGESLSDLLDRAGRGLLRNEICPQGTFILRASVYKPERFV
jgi:GGDEF domain-containing protein